MTTAQPLLQGQVVSTLHYPLNHPTSSSLLPTNRMNRILRKKKNLKTHFFRNRNQSHRIQVNAVSRKP
jgi:hypothetical protein